MSDPLVAAPPAIPVGLGTFVGLGTGAGQWAAAIVSAVNGDHSATTIALIVTGALTVITTLIGRFAQAHARIKSAGGLVPLAEHLGSAVVNVSQADTPDETEVAIGQTDPDQSLDVHQGTVPPDEGDAEAGS